LDLGQLIDENHLLVQNLLKENATLAEQLQHARDENTLVQSDLQAQKSDYATLIGDITRICNEKGELHEELEKERFQKDFEQLLLDQYRGEILEQRDTIGKKERRIQELLESTARVQGETDAMRARCMHYEQSFKAGEEEIAQLRQELETKRRELIKQETATAQLHKQWNEAMEGCVYYRSQINKLGTACDNLAAKVADEANSQGSAGAQRGNGRRRRRRARYRQGGG
jgi:chromosome segregation ATPase